MTGIRPPFDPDKDGYFHTGIDSAEGCIIGGRLIDGRFTDEGATAWNSQFGDLDAPLTLEDLKRWREVASHFGSWVDDDFTVTCPSAGRISRPYEIMAFGHLLVLLDALGARVVN